MTPKSQLPGKKVTLRPITFADFNSIFSWITHPQVVPFWYGRDRPITLTWVKNHFTPIVTGTSRSQCWIILAKNQPLGFMYATPILDDDGHPTGRVEMDIVIGSPQEWGKGYATDALNTLIKYAFASLSAQRIFLTPRTNNARAIHLYKKVGFRKEGILRHFEKFEGHWVDCLMMSLIKPDFDKIKSKL